MYPMFLKKKWLCMQYVFRFNFLEEHEKHTNRESYQICSMMMLEFDEIVGKNTALNIY